MDHDPGALRHDYGLRSLERSDVGDDPLTVVSQWFDEAVAQGVHEPNAMALATASADAAPSCRFVLMKGLDARGVVFYTNYGSRKGRELDANPRAAATLLWHPMERQVRIEGRVERVASEESDAYFASRPRGARIAAAASAQSREVADRSALERAVKGLEARHEGEDVPRPPTWGGYRIVPDRIELWQGGRNRVHDRFAFERKERTWSVTRLQP